MHWHISQQHPCSSVARLRSGERSGAACTLTHLRGMQAPEAPPQVAAEGTNSAAVRSRATRPWRGSRSHKHWLFKLENQWVQMHQGMRAEPHDHALAETESKISGKRQCRRPIS